ncbi:MAG: efflux RND transporter periplasmic adaptor subunit [Desulfobacteraceae bacterium]|jgi:RND family efflux transporter MFP subunit|nr:MAG: efflux RND transporter periplasmic adaptor subunit [Desulfobacteraceae bacterium]
MKYLPVRKSTLALLAILIPLLALFGYVAFRSGPLAPIPVTLATVESKRLSPALFGIGNIEARYTYKIGPTVAGRLKHLDVDVGDRVEAGRLLGEMDPVDLDDRIRAQEAALKRASAQLSEATERKNFAREQASRYEKLLKARATSEEIFATKQQELKITDALQTAAYEDLARMRAEIDALTAQRRNLNLVAPADGLVAARNAEPGATVTAGSAVLELIDPHTLWINVRFDQVHAQGLAAGLPARITLRSQAGQTQDGRILRVEPVADVVTEEILAKVVFNQLPEPLPPVGELAEVTVELPGLPPEPVIPNAAVKRINGKLGVWRVENKDLIFTPISLGHADLDGRVTVREGLKAGDRIVLYSEKALTVRSRIYIVDKLPGAAP